MNQRKPPKWADRFLAWYCNPKLLEQIQGDVHELFYWRLEEKGPEKAGRAFVWDVIRLFKWSNIKRTKRKTQKINNIAMFKTYFKIGLRNLWKQRMPSTINIIGLSLAIGCCIVSFKWIEFNTVKDNFHKRADDIYLVTPVRTVDGYKNRYGKVRLDVGDKIASEVPGVDEVIRLRQSEVKIETNDNTFENLISFADPNFFEVFSFPEVHGDVGAFKDLSAVVISESFAETMFGTEYPIGKVLRITLDDEVLNFEVRGVFGKPRGNSSIRLELIVNFEVYRRGKDPQNNTANTFVLLNEQANQQTTQANMASIVEYQRASDERNPYEEIKLEPLITMASNSNDIYGGLGNTPPMAPIVVLTCIGVFMLILSISNYVNISTMMAMKRVKEIGVRKVIGGQRRQLIMQFMVENLILCVLAMVIGALLASAFFLPWFNKISGSVLTLDIEHHKNLWLFLGALLMFVTFASGAYPAFYISSFKPVVIFRGMQRSKSKRWLTSLLLTFQMTLAIITIVAGVMFVHTNKVNESRDWGYDQYSKLVVRLPEKVTYQTLTSELEKLPDVEGIAGSRGFIGLFFDRRKVVLEEQEDYVAIFPVTDNYAELMEVRLKEGQFFDKGINTQSKSILVNEAFMNRFGLSIDNLKPVTLDSTTYAVVGVVEDFHYSSFSDIIRPALFKLTAEDDITDVTVKVREGTALTMRETLKDIMEELEPEERAQVYVQDAVFDHHFEEMDGIRNIMLFTATLSILLSAMGLFGLVSINISSRIRDFGIKKVLGATARHLSNDVYRKFAVILAIAVLVGGALSVFIIEMLLDSAYGYHESIGVIPLSLAAIILLFIAFITINTQIRQVKKMNPAETLRVE